MKGKEAQTEKSDFYKESRISLILTLLRLPDLISALAAAFVSKSMVVWVEVVESASIVIPCLLIFVLTKKLNKNLKFKFNYGTGKIEAITSLCCEIFDIAGLFCIFLVSVRRLISPQTNDGMYLTGAVMLLLGVLVDLYFYRKQKALLESTHGKIFHTAAFSAKIEFVFDCIALVTLFLEFLFREHSWSAYIAPSVCILACISFTIALLKNISDSLSELSDVTLGEEEQMELLSVLTKYFDEYSRLGEVRSRKSGNTFYFDIEMSFPADRTCGEIGKTVSKIRKEVEEKFENCITNIVLIT